MTAMVGRGGTGSDHGRPEPAAHPAASPTAASRAASSRMASTGSRLIAVSVPPDLFPANSETTPRVGTFFRAGAVGELKG